MNFVSQWSFWRIVMMRRIDIRLRQAPRPGLIWLKSWGESGESKFVTALSTLQTETVVNLHEKHWRWEVFYWTIFFFLLCCRNVLKKKGDALGRWQCTVLTSKTGLDIDSIIIVCKKIMYYSYCSRRNSLQRHHNASNVSKPATILSLYKMFLMYKFSSVGQTVLKFSLA